MKAATAILLCYYALVGDGYSIIGECSLKPRPQTRQSCTIINYGHGCQNPSGIPRAETWAAAPRDLAVTFRKHPDFENAVCLRISFKPPDDASSVMFRGVMVKVMAMSGRHFGQMAVCLIVNFSSVHWNQVGKQTKIVLDLNHRGYFNRPVVAFTAGENYVVNVESLPARVAYSPNQGERSARAKFRFPNSL